MTPEWKLADGAKAGTDHSAQPLFGVHAAARCAGAFAEDSGALGQRGQSRFSRNSAGPERGYALLTVLLMAALVAFYLYAQMPRVAFESERDKEQTLIDRGEQYKRAIQLYVTAVKKYPAKIEDLENTNDKRYLRRRYIDPYTGKDEWRLIHVNAGGQLTDSLVQKPPAAPGANGQMTGGPLSGPGTSTSAMGTAAAGTSTGPNANGTTTPTDPNDVNAAVRRRPSDVVGQAYTQPVEADPNNPATWAPITITAPTGTGTGPTGQPPSGAVGFNGGLNGAPMPGLPGQQPGQQPGQPGMPGQPMVGGFPLPGQPGFNTTQNQFKIDANGQLVPVTPTQTGAVINSQNGGVQNTQLGAPPVGGINAPGINAAGNGGPAGAQNAATSAINAMLTNPNPQPGVGGLGTSAGMTTGGIAGVASMYKGPSIKIYGGRQKYQEWEFIFKLDNGNGAGGQQANPLTPGQNGLNGPQNGAAPAGSTTGGATAAGASPGGTTPGSGN
jgi:hypothetical protein